MKGLHVGASPLLLFTLAACSGASDGQFFVPGADEAGTVAAPTPAPADGGGAGSVDATVASPDAAGAAVTAADASAPDPGLRCDAKTKACGAACVSLQDPLFGCGAASCAPCAVPTGGTATCALGACGQACPAGSNLCGGACVVETATSCGATCANCMQAHTKSATCTKGACVIKCATDYADCDNDPKNGCETDTSSSDANCGQCGNACVAGYCFGGQCN